MLILIIECLFVGQSFGYFTTTYDYVIIGGGSSGTVLANRLSQDSHSSVLLLEAGKVPPAQADIPAVAAQVLLTEVNWGYSFEKQQNFGMGMENQRIPCARGKALGGSSAINWMMYVRGNSKDFDDWYARGNKGWSYKEVLPYFKKSEDCTVEIQDGTYHGRGGNLTVEDVRYRTKSAEMFVKGMEEYGDTYVDYNGKTQTGVSYIQVNTKRGMRASGYRAFLEPVMQRSNLKVVTEAMVTNILITHLTKIAYGVQFLQNGTKQTAFARKEVILSAGAVNSPKILMLSGIGPKEHLQDLGIQPLVDLPVGKKLYDHPNFLGLTFSINESITFSTDQLLSERAMQELLVNGTGPLTSTGLVEAIATIDTQSTNSTVPDIELIYAAGSFPLDNGTVLRKALGVSQEMYDAFWKKHEGKPSFMILPVLFRPKSYGYLKLKSKNPTDAPLLYGNYLTDKENSDVKVFIASIRRVLDIVKMPAFRRYNTTLISSIPGCEKHQYDTDDYWECGLRHLSSTTYHLSTTCKMGPKDDNEAVVDKELKVHGVQRLRVVDTSVIPEPTRGHTNAIAYMIAEKASDMIKWDHNLDMEKYGRL